MVLKMCKSAKYFLMFDHIHWFVLKFNTVNANEVVDYLLLAARKATDIWFSLFSFPLF